MNLAALLAGDKTPPDLVSNHRTLSVTQTASLEETLATTYFTDPEYFPDGAACYLATAEGQAGLRDHVSGRLGMFRNLVIPWLNSVMPLRNKRVLEIGCGTGASTVALAEQDVQILAVDVNAQSIRAAEYRCQLHGVAADFLVANAGQLEESDEIREFAPEIIVFFAVLEHMTWEERSAALSWAWSRLAPGQHLAVIETPNRLWHTDAHTSREPFFHWLPDNIAIEYSKHVDRRLYNQMFREISPAAMTTFFRWGRGVSYHDFVLSFGIAARDLPVVSSFAHYRRARRGTQWLGALRAGRRFERRLNRLAPGVHCGFFVPNLDLIFHKP